MKPRLRALRTRGAILALSLGLSVGLVGAAPVADWRAVPAAEEVRTEVYFLRHLTVERASALYERMLGIGANTWLGPGKGGGTLVVRDTDARLGRFRRVLDTIDVDEGHRDGVRVFARAVLHRRPQVVADLVLQTWQAAGRGPIALVGDDRSRLLIVRARLEEYRVLDRMIRKLDREEKGGVRR